MRALLSVSDPQGLVEFAAALHGRGWALVATDGTARRLDAAGLPATPVSALTRFPEILDGRVKTLHPAVHGGILARRHRPEDLATLARHGIEPLDLVAVNLYPFTRTAARDDLTFDELVEQIDIGGPALVRAAAKNCRDVLVVVDPADYAAVLAALDRPGGPDLAFRLRLAGKAFAHTAAYDEAIAAALDAVRVDGTACVPQVVRFDGLLPDRVILRLLKRQDLRYGENPHQVGAWYVEAERHEGFARAELLQGKALSYTNLLDLDAAARLVAEFDEPAAVVVKHMNPCGVALGEALAEAYCRARDADRPSAFGGIVGLNRAIDEATAHALVATFLEAVVAPGVEETARAVLATRPNLRVVVLPTGGGAPTTTSGEHLGSGREVRSILGGWLVQERDRVEEAAPPWTAETAGGLRVVTRRAPTAEEWTALRFAWRVVAHVRSNAVVFARARETVAIGAGQMSRVDAVHVAVMKGGGRLAGTVAASDAFFPFRDSVDAIAAAGATAIVQPGGSVRDSEVIAAADAHGLAMVFTGRRHFRH